jgi:hypothetical protein
MQELGKLKHTRCKDHSDNGDIQVDRYDVNDVDFIPVEENDDEDDIEDR